MNGWAKSDLDKLAEKLRELVEKRRIDGIVCVAYLGDGAKLIVAAPAGTAYDRRCQELGEELARLITRSELVM